MDEAEKPPHKICARERQREREFEHFITTIAV